MSSMPILLDLFCGAGGAAWGYHLAGFTVVGVDNKRQPNYPFEFIQADVFDLMDHDLSDFDFIHASPPCQDHTQLRSLTESHGTGWMLNATRILLQSTGLPW